jgi:hypothetical protein
MFGSEFTTKFPTKGDSALFAARLNVKFWVLRFDCVVVRGAALPSGTAD